MNEVGALAPWGVQLWGARAVEEALRNPSLRVGGRRRWHVHPAVHDLVDRMPSMHDDAAHRESIVTVWSLLSPDSAHRAAPVMRAEMARLAAEVVCLPGPEVDLVRNYTSLIAPTFLHSHLALADAVTVSQLRDFSASLGLELAHPETPDALRVAQILNTTHALTEFAALLRATGPADHPLDALIASVPDDRDVAAVIALLASGGQETVSSLASSAIIAMVEDPEFATAWDRDPGPVLDDLVARQPPITMLARISTAETTAGGLPILAERTVLLQLDRGASEAGLAFGMGLHRCLGRNVARLLVPIAVNALREAWPQWPPRDLRPEGRPEVPVFRGPSHLFARLASLDHVNWHDSQAAPQKLGE